jgi:hypothetical protein
MWKYVSALSALLLAGRTAFYPSFDNPLNPDISFRAECEPTHSSVSVLSHRVCSSGTVNGIARSLHE